jgi:protein associated with RNAse G/E
MIGEFEKEVVHTDLGVIDRGTVSYEYYWLDRWYNVFRFHQPHGQFRNYYCNINLPPTYENGILDYVDLDIDLLVDRQWRVKILDFDEFERNAGLFSIPDTVCRSAKLAVDKLITLIEKRNFPFDQS